MKRTVCLIFSILAMLVLSCGCAINGLRSDSDRPIPIQHEKTDVWNGKTAARFHKGNGSRTDPYQIRTADELAYLAEQVNSGKEFENNYFQLTANLDLNRIPWTPIGNGTFSFAGHFDGGGCRIEHLNVEKEVAYRVSYPHGTQKFAVAGLFGSCKNGSIRNLTLSEASVNVENADSCDKLYAGCLSGVIEVRSNCRIRSVKVENSELQSRRTAEKSSRAPRSEIYLGGMVGKIDVESVAECRLETLQSEVTVKAEEVRGELNFNGSLVGKIDNQNLFECSSFAGYLTLLCPLTEEYPSGAFGGLSNGNGCTRLSDAFSQVKVNQPADTVLGSPVYAIAGKMNQEQNRIGSFTGSFDFQNLFGCIVMETETENSTEAICKLFSPQDHMTVTETNCSGVIELPPHHNFDFECWNLEDRRHPTLKLNP